MTLDDPAHVAARQGLLDVLEALKPHAESLVLIGAQAVSVHTGFGAAPTAVLTTDADLMINPARLSDRPDLDRLLIDAGFERRAGHPGAWSIAMTLDGRSLDVPVDLMVPDRVAPGRGRRSVALSGHDRLAARRTAGLEAALVDNAVRAIRSWSPHDSRVVEMRVAGPTALTIAKLFKIAERVEGARADRVQPKDAGDVYRLMLATPSPVFAQTVGMLLDDKIAAATTQAGLEKLDRLFGARGSVGVRLAIESLSAAVPADRVAAVCTGFVRDLRRELHG